MTAGRCAKKNFPSEKTHVGQHPMSLFILPPEQCLRAGGLRRTGQTAVLRQSPAAVRRQEASRRVPILQPRPEMRKIRLRMATPVGGATTRPATISQRSGPAPSARHTRSAAFYCCSASPSARHRTHGQRPGSWEVGQIRTTDTGSACQNPPSPTAQQALRACGNSAAERCPAARACTGQGALWWQADRVTRWQLLNTLRRGTAILLTPCAEQL